MLNAIGQGDHCKLKHGYVFISLLIVPILFAVIPQVSICAHPRKIMEFFDFFKEGWGFLKKDLIFIGS